MTAAELRTLLEALDRTIQRYAEYGTVPRHLAEARSIYTILTQWYIQAHWRELTERAREDWEAGR